MNYLKKYKEANINPEDVHKFAQRKAKFSANNKSHQQKKPAKVVQKARQRIHQIVSERLNSYQGKENCNDEKVSFDSLNSFDVCIGDFGLACDDAKHHTDKICSREYRAPETLLGLKDWGLKVSFKIGKAKNNYLKSNRALAQK